MDLIPPLAIIQARLHSQRFPDKMLALLQGKPLLQWAWDTAVEVFDFPNVVVACPIDDVPSLAPVVPHAMIWGYCGAVNDVLGRLHEAAHQYRTDPSTVIYRCTPDDVPLQTSRDWCSLRQLTLWHEETSDSYLREHVGYLYHPEMPVEVNTPEDFAYLKRRRVEG